MTDKAELTYKHLISDFSLAVRQMISTGRLFKKNFQTIILPLAENYFSSMSAIAFAAQTSVVDTGGKTKEIGALILQISRVFKESVVQIEKLCKMFEDEFMNPVERDLAVGMKKYSILLKQSKANTRSVRKPVEKLLAKKQKEKHRKLAFLKGSPKESERLQIIAECEQQLKEIEDRELVQAEAVEFEAFNTFFTRLVDVTNQTAAVVEGANSTFVNLTSSTPVEEFDLKNDVDADTHEAIFSPADYNQTNFSQSSSDSPSIQKSKNQLITSGKQVNRYRAAKAIHGSASFKSAHNLPNLSSLSFPSLTLTAKRTSLSTSALVSPARRSTLDVLSRSDLEKSSNSTNRVRTALFRFESQTSHGSRQQLSFNAGDNLVSVGNDHDSGWQYGKNISTNQYGWFPVAFTEFPGESTNKPESSEEPEASMLNGTNEDTHSDEKPASNTNSLSQSPMNSADMIVNPLSEYATINGPDSFDAADASTSNSIATPSLSRQPPTPPPLPQASSQVTMAKAKSIFASQQPGMRDVFAELRAKTLKRTMDLSSTGDEHSSTQSNGSSSGAKNANFPAPPTEFLVD